MKSFDFCFWRKRGRITSVELTLMPEAAAALERGLHPSAHEAPTAEQRELLDEMHSELQSALREQGR